MIYLNDKSILAALLLFSQLGWNRRAQARKVEEQNEMVKNTKVQQKQQV